MPLRIKCPTGHSLIVPDDRAGRTLKCPRCDESVLVPGEAVSATAAAETPSPAAVDRVVMQVAAQPAQAVAVAPPRPAPAKQPLPSPKPSQKSPIPPRKSPPLLKPAIVTRPVVKPKSRVLPVAPPQAASPPAAAAEPPPPTPAPPTPPSIEKVTAPPVAETPPIVESPADVGAANERLDGSLALPANEPPTESLPLSSPPPDPAPTQPPAAHDSSDDIAALLKLHFADQPVPSSPQRPSAAVSRDMHDADADASRTLAVYQLAAALVVAALFSVAPAVWDLVEYIRIDELDAPFVARWALVLFFIGIVQLAYAVFLFQLPDWASVWVVTLFQLALAAAYAALLGIVLISDASGLLVGPQGLQLADKLAGGKAALWCLCMVSVATILAFFAGRMSVRWRQAERMLQSVQFGSAH